MQKVWDCVDSCILYCIADYLQPFILPLWLCMNSWRHSYQLLANWYFIVLARAFYDFFTWRVPTYSPRMPLTLKYAGGRWIQPIGREIACHFSQDHTMVTKFLDFIHKHPKYKVVKSFFYYLDRFSRNSAETESRSWFFGIENRKIDFFQLFYNKVPKFYFKSEWQLFSAFFWGV